jgi:hypothetical protein
VKGDVFKLLPLAIPTHTDLRDRLGRLGRLRKDALDEQVEVANEFKAFLEVCSLLRSTEALALMR